MVKKRRDVPLTADYLPSAYYGAFHYSRNRPPFTHFIVREMLVDPRVSFGLKLIKGPIASQYRVNVVAEDERVRTFIEKNIARFWRNSAVRVLKALEWGYSGSEVLYRIGPDGLLHFDTVKDLDSPDVRPVVLEGEIVGMTVRNVPFYSGDSVVGCERLFIPKPKMLWHVHDRHRNSWFGASILYPAVVPWWELWSEGGFRDSRRLWYYKNSFEGGVMYHPPGITRLENGQIVTNKDLARELIEKKRTGGVLTLPNDLIGEGRRAWEYEPPSANTAPTGLDGYGADLRHEIFEALGIPPEVIESVSGEGAETGRKIPLIAFYSTLQEIGNWLLTDFDEFVLSFLVEYNFGDVAYELEPESLVEEVTGHSQEKLLREMAQTEALPEQEEIAGQAGQGAEGAGRAARRNPPGRIAQEGAPGVTGRRTPE